MRASELLFRDAISASWIIIGASYTLTKVHDHVPLALPMYPH